jgi:hypothetical protein
VSWTAPVKVNAGVGVMRMAISLFKLFGL